MGLAKHGETFLPHELVPGTEVTVALDFPFTEVLEVTTVFGRNVLITAASFGQNAVVLDTLPVKIATN